MIVIQLVDKLIEYVQYKKGIDIYKGAENLISANMLYILGTTNWDTTLFQQMCSSFVKWTRTASIEDGNTFYTAASHLYNTLSHEKDKWLLGLIVESEKYRDKISDSFEKYGMDATVSCLVEHCHYWKTIYSQPFNILFDNSKQIEHWRTFIELLNNLPAAEVGFGTRKHTYPLQIKDLHTGDSKTNKQLQLADLMASYLNYYFICQAKKQKDNFADKVGDTALVNVIGNRMWPGDGLQSLLAGSEDESGQNSLDFFASQAKLKPEQFAKVIRKKRK